MTLLDAVEQYVKSRFLSPATIKSYRSHINRLVHVVGNKQVSAITMDDMIAFRQDMLRTASSITFNTARCHLRAIFNHCFEHGHIQKNPTKFVKPAPVPKLPPKRIEQVEFAKIFEYIETSRGYTSNLQGHWASPSWYWIAVLKLFYFTGMRLRQISALQWQDIDFEKNLITLKYASSKTHREWQIPVAKDLKPYLLELWNQTLKVEPNVQRASRVLILKRFDSTRKSDSEKTAKSQISDFFTRVRRHTGIKISPHKVRHSTATDLMRKTNNPKLVQEILGHASLSTTMLYVQPELEDMQNLLNCL